MEKTQFFKNLEFFKDNLNVSEEEFYSPSGKNKSNQQGVISIGKTSYEKYRKGTIPRPNTLTEITLDLNTAIKKDPLLSAKFPTGILPTDLRDKDLSLATNAFESNSQPFFSHKMLGAYICYYNSTNMDEDKTQNYGVIQITATDKKDVLEVSGVFSLKNYTQAQEIHAMLSEDKKLADIAAERKISLFTGNVYLKTTLMWINLINQDQSDFLSISFDLAEKILTKNQNKLYLGSRGIALSSTSGEKYQSAAFPFVITKKPLAVSVNELAKYLLFRYTKIEDSEVQLLAKEMIALLNSISNNNVLSYELQTKLLAVTLTERLSSYLERTTYNSHYFIPKEITEFYNNIISPIRENFYDYNVHSDVE